MNVLDILVYVWGALGVGGDWMPLPTHLQRYCDPASLTLFIFYKNVIFWPKPSKEIE